MPIFFNATPTLFQRRLIRLGGEEAIIYTSEYEKLLEATKLFKWDDEDEFDTRAVRIGLSTNYDIKLGKEGPPNRKNPPHEKLTGEYCIFAGNEFFNADNELCIISNKSSDYHPTFNAMQYLLIAQLYEGKVRFAENIILRKYSKSTQTEEIKVSRENLIKELEKLDFHKTYPTLKKSENVSPSKPSKPKSENVSPSKPSKPKSENISPNKTAGQVPKISDSPLSFHKTPSPTRKKDKRKVLSPDSKAEVNSGESSKKTFKRLSFSSPNNSSSSSSSLDLVRETIKLALPKFPMAPAAESLTPEQKLYLPKPNF